MPSFTATNLRPAYLFAVLVLTAPTAGLTTFHTNCTIPDSTYQYVQGPNTRGSLQIVWSCLATLIACTYTVLHLNVPEQLDGRDGASEKYLESWWKGTNPSLIRTALDMTSMVYPWRRKGRMGKEFAQTVSTLQPLATDEPNVTRQDFSKRIGADMRWWAKALGGNVSWMAITVMAPEYHAFLAVAELDSAMKWKSEFERLPRCCHPASGWTLTHMFFTQIGGFAIRYDTSRRPRDITHLTAQSLFKLIHRDPGRLSTKAFPTAEDILDRSKSDMLAKGLVVLQLTWFVVNCFTRLAKRMHTTQLQMSIAGIALCSLATFAVLFGKPRSVTTTTVLMSFDGQVPSDVLDIVASDDQYRHDSKRTISNSISPPLPDDTRRSLKIVRLLGALMPLGAMVLGAFHLAAWDCAFPSSADKWVWRTASLASVCAVPFLLLAFFIDRHGRALAADRLAVGAVGSMLVCTLLYFGSRAVLAVEMVRFVFYIPPGAFLTKWADNIPHI